VWKDLQLLPLLSRNVRAHVPGIRDGEEGLVAQLGHLAVPLLFCVSRGVEVGDVLFAQLGERVDDPVPLAFDAGRSVAERCWALGSVD